jgi:hypothetical protein
MASTMVSGFFPRVAFTFATMANTDLISFVRNLVILITGNPLYPTPLPALAAITTAVDAFELAVQEASGRDKLAIATRNARRVELLSLVRQLAAYVQNKCDADLVNLISSGFDAVRAPSPVGVPPPPANQRLGLTNKSGELVLRFDKVPNANNYSVQTALDDNGPWTDQPVSSSTRVLLTGLTPGKAYWARAAANGSQGSSGWGGPATAIVV